MNYSYSYAASGAGAVIMFLLMIAFYVLVVIGLWKTFIKAGHPGWAAIIPFYNLYIWVQIAGRPVWWFWVMLIGALLAWIPIIGWILMIGIWVMSLFLALDVAKNFGQGTGFGVLLWFFSGIMYLVLGFGSYQYKQVANLPAGAGLPMGQPVGQPMAPPPAAGQYVPPAAGQYVPPTPGPAAQPMTPPPPLVQPLQPQPLTPPPAQAAPYTTPPAEAAAPTPPPASPTPPPPPPPPVT